MPITQDNIKEANRKMLGKTNRTILFARVNNDEYLDPDLPEKDQQMTPSLAAMLPRIMEEPAEKFIAEVRENLTVTNFREFLEKFQPGFYYRVAPTQAAATPVGGDTISADAVEGAESADGEESAAPVEAEEQGAIPKLQFSLEGGKQWKKVNITMEHPYIACLTKLLKQRVRMDVSTFRVDVDASLFTFKPKNQRALMRKLAENVQVKNDTLMLEAKRDKASTATRRALEAYKGASDEFRGALEDAVRVLPTVVYGLEQTAREMRRLAPGGGPIDNTVYQIEFGTNRKSIASPQKLPKHLAEKTEVKALDGAAKTPKGLEEGGAAPKALEGGAGETALAKKEAELAKKEKGTEDTALSRPIEKALDMIRVKYEDYVNVDIAQVPQEKRYPIAVSKFMDQMVNRGLVAPLMGNMLAVVLQNPKDLAELNPDIKDIEYFHDTFLRDYSAAVEDFLKTVTPLFETIMGVYLLFNEFPADVSLPESKRPELIIANADLPELFLTREDELLRFFEIHNAQAANQFRDSISFCIVPKVEKFGKSRPKKEKGPSIMLDDPLLASIQAAQEEAADQDGALGYGSVTFKEEMIPMMDWGLKHGFQILFSPEEKVIAGRAQRGYFEGLRDDYAIESVVDNESADAAILCLPDFVLMPPDGKLITGKTADGNIEVGVDVPELAVRSCYVAAGRLMANDIPEYLQRKMLKNRRDSAMVRMDIPGVGVDLSVNTFLGESDMPTDHFLEDGLVGGLLSPDMPFSVFTHVAGRSPFLSVPRTMRRINDVDGTSSYRMLHLFRQQVYLNRLLRAAHELGFAGSFPADNTEAEDFLRDHVNFIITFSKWHNPGHYVNSFPSKLAKEEPFTVTRIAGNNFRFAFRFDQGLISEFGVSF